MSEVTSTKKDSFFIGKKLKNPKRSTSRQTPEPISNSNSTTSASTTSFFIKSTKNQQKNETKKSEKPKKIFDKKKWRLQKYSNKYKLEQWEEKRKKTVLNEYYKQVENEPKFDVQKIYEKYADEEDNDNENNLNQLGLPDSSNKEPESQTDISTNLNELPKDTTNRKIANRVLTQFQRKREEKERKKEEIKKKIEAKAEALKVYKQQKFEKYKKLSKKTKKGQPIMKYRMEMLLEQIQKSVQ